MKKIMFLVALVVLLVSVFGAAIPVLADDPDENFKKAGQKVLAEKERVLMELKTAIDAFVVQSLADRVAVGEEMITLNKMVDDFAQVKAEADGYLELYDLSTKTVLEEELVSAVKNYYEGDGFFKRDDGGKTKAFFVRLTGGDVVVMRSGMVIDGVLILMMVFVAFLLFLAIIFAWPPNRKIAGTVVCGFFFVLLLLLFFLA